MLRFLGFLALPRRGESFNQCFLREMLILKQIVIKALGLTCWIFLVFSPSPLWESSFSEPATEEEITQPRDLRWKAKIPGLYVFDYFPVLMNAFRMLFISSSIWVEESVWMDW